MLSSNTRIADDFGLAEVADFLDKMSAKGNGSLRQDALVQFAEAAMLESSGELKQATKKYNMAFRAWPALDSIPVGGIPKGVREEACKADFCGRLLTEVEVSKARRSAVNVKRQLLTSREINELLAMSSRISEMDGGCVGNNPENKTHAHKFAIMVNDPPTFHLQNELPSVIGKVAKFAEESLGNWCHDGGPLEGVVGMHGLSIRVAEVWTYDVGGGLEDNYHFDTDSIMTIVCLLSPTNEFEGGTFQTFEEGDTQLDYGMEWGDGVCFVSHKYHNIKTVTSGQRKSLVVELWEGGSGGKGRG